MTEEELEKEICLDHEKFDFLRSKGVYLVYCSNKELGTDGPFVQIDSLVGLKSALSIEEYNEQINHDDDILIVGEIDE